MPLQNVSGGHSALDVEDGADDDDDQRVVETDPTGRFERYAVSLGKGAYKEVYKAFDQEEGVEVAWNQLKLDNLNKRDAQRILSEIQILQSLQNENIINFIHSWSSPVVSEKDGRVTGERVCFITELMTSGTLKNYIRKTKGPVKPKVLKNWCRQVLSGLHYLHTRNPPIIHRDLKCDNIFINGNNGQAKIGDLGLATVKDRDHVSSVLGTPEFMAPELYDENYTESVDIYAFGLCILEIVTKEYPYSECTNQAQIYKKVTMGIKPAALQKIESEEIRDFITLCIQSDPQKRPSAVELLKNSFLQIQPNSSVHLSAMDLSLDAAVSGTHPEEASEQKLPTPTSIEQVKDAPDPKRLSGLGSGAVASTTKVDADNHTYVILQRSAAGAPKPGTYASVAAAGNAVISNSQAKISSVMVDILDRPNENEVQLKMVYAAAGRASKDIKFPFSLLDDTATDVVAEMVRENLIEGPDEQLARRKLEEAVKNVFLRQQREGGWRGPSPTNSERGVSSTSSGGEPRSMEFHPGGGGPHVSFAPGTAGEGGRRPSFNLPRTPSQSSLAEQAGLRRTVGSASTGALGNMSNVPSSANSTYSTSSSASSRPSTPPVILYPQGPRPPTPGMYVPNPPTNIVAGVPLPLSSSPGSPRRLSNVAGAISASYPPRTVSEVTVYAPPPGPPPHHVRGNSASAEYTSRSGQPTTFGMSPAVSENPSPTNASPPGSQASYFPPTPAYSKESSTSSAVSEVGSEWTAEQMEQLGTLESIGHTQQVEQRQLQQQQQQQGASQGAVRGLGVHLQLTTQPGGQSPTMRPGEGFDGPNMSPSLAVPTQVLPQYINTAAPLSSAGSPYAGVTTPPPVGVGYPNAGPPPPRFTTDPLIQQKLLALQELNIQNLSSASLYHPGTAPSAPKYPPHVPPNAVHPHHQSYHLQHHQMQPPITAPSSSHDSSPPSLLQQQLAGISSVHLHRPPSVSNVPGIVNSVGTAGPPAMYRSTSSDPYPSYPTLPPPPNRSSPPPPSTSQRLRQSSTGTSADFVRAMQMQGATAASGSTGGGGGKDGKARSSVDLLG